MWAVQVALVACLLTPSVAYFFETGYTHHYTYWAENSLQDQHNITTVLKVVSLLYHWRVYDSRISQLVSW